MVGPSEAAFSTNSAHWPVQDGVWAGARGCFLIRGILIPPRQQRAAKEMQRTHPSPVPEGTCATALSSAVVLSKSWQLRRSCEPVILARRPHLVQHDSQFAGQRDLGLAQSATLR